MSTSPLSTGSPNAAFTSRVIPALDRMSLVHALDLVYKLTDLVQIFKGHALFDENDIKYTVKKLKLAGARQIWMDAKFDDTPDTVADRCAKLRDAQVDYITVHAMSGPEMIAKAIEAAAPAKIIVVTVLTSFSTERIKSLFKHELQTALVLATEAAQAGAKYIVCAGTQVGMLASSPSLLGVKFIVPGTRSTNVATHDQKQVVTPYEAVLSGANMLVGGREVTSAADPTDAVRNMARQIQRAEENIQSAAREDDQSRIITTA